MASDSNMTSNFNSFQIFVFVVALAMAVFLSIVLGAQMTISSYHKFTAETPQDIANLLDAETRTAIVFGSGIDPQGNPRPILMQRLKAALELYDENVVDVILVSGYNPAPDYNEPLAMKRYLVARGIPSENIIQDVRGDNTFMTCNRSLHVHGVSQAVLVTQSQHLDRALYLCRSRGIEAYGYTASQSSEQRWRYVQSARESISNVKAILNVRYPGITLFH
jgi:vancomycin permeability regulator SanA